MKQEKTLPVTEEPVTLFGRFALARDSRTLYADGQTVTLNERAMDVLIALVDARGKIISIEELQQRLWPSLSMVATSVQALVSQLRRALGDDRDLIETVPRRGYRLTAAWYESRDVPVFPGNDATWRSAPAGLSAALPSATPPALSAALSAASSPGSAPFASASDGLPADASLPLVGRDAELSELSIRVPQQRLVTLLGPRGVGKTRLARDAALRVAALFHEPAAFVGFAEVTLPGQVAATIAAQFPPLSPPRRPECIDTLIARLAGKPTLLVIEDADHLVHEVAAVVEALLAATPVCVLVCAQAPLFAAAEYLLPLAPLRCAPPETSANALADSASLDWSDAARLFALQLAARNAVPRSSDDASHSADSLAAVSVSIGLDALPEFLPERARIESICRSLGGNPLALELAATQIAAACRRLPVPADALADWHARWRTLLLRRTGNADATVNDATLIPTLVALAYRTLEAGAQHVLSGASLFGGKFENADALAVCMPGALDGKDQEDDGIEEIEEIDPSGMAVGERCLQRYFTTLLDAGLLLDSTPAEANDDRPAVHARLLDMPPAVRRFALGELSYRRDYEALAARYAQRIAERLTQQPLERSAGAEPSRTRGGAQTIATVRVSDVRRALGWSLEAGRLDLAARLLQHSTPVWAAARLMDERLHWIGRALDRDGAVSMLKVRDRMQLTLALAQALPGSPAASAGAGIEAWWRVYELATACADDDTRLRALSVLLMGLLEAGFGEEPLEPLARVRGRIAQECDGSSTHPGFGLLHGALLTLGGRHHEAVKLLAPADLPDSDELSVDSALPADSGQPAAGYVEALARNGLALSLWLSGARSKWHPVLLRTLREARQRADPVSHCAAAAMASLLFLLEDNLPRMAQQARVLCAIAQRAGLDNWLRAGRGFLLWAEAVDDTSAAATQLVDHALNNLTRGYGTVMDLRALERFTDLALLQAEGPTLVRLTEQMIANLDRLGRRWVLPEAMRVHAVLLRRTGASVADVRALLDQAAQEAHRQHARMLLRRIEVSQAEVE